jgi:putative membrane protein
MKKHISIALIGLGCWGVFACNEAGKGDRDTTDTVSSSPSTTDTSVTNTQSSAPPDSATVMFMKKAASGALMEVELGKIAQEKSQNQRVKDFGAMMVRDHSKANDELKSIASAKSVTLSDSLTPEHKRDVANLQKRKGDAFDKAYISMMVEDHQKDISEFEKASNTLADGEVKAFATRALPTLQTHLDSANAIKTKK